MIFPPGDLGYWTTIRAVAVAQSLRISDGTDTIVAEFSLRLEDNSDVCCEGTIDEKRSFVVAAQQ